jgi:hypothetical protein
MTPPALSEGKTLWCEIWQAILGRACLCTWCEDDWATAAPLLDRALATARAEGAAAEREGCALEAESERLLYTADRETRVAERACERIAAAIRQRGAGGS